MKISVNTILSTCLLFSFIHPSMCLSIENGNLYYTSGEDIYGFQFNHNNCISYDSNSGSSGDAEVAGFSISVSASTVLGFSFSGAFIPAGSGILMEDVECNEITNLIFSGPADNNADALQLQAEFLENGCEGYLNVSETLLPNAISMTTHPNPFNPLCVINYSIPFYGHVKMSLFDIKGRELQVPINKIMPKGNHEFIIDGSNLCSGIYFVSISHNNEQLIRKISLVK